MKFNKLSIKFCQQIISIISNFQKTFSKQYQNLFHPQSPLLIISHLNKKRKRSYFLSPNLS